MRIGVIGMGVIGRVRAETVDESAGAELAAVADVNRVAVAEIVGRTNARAFTDYEKMFAEARLDAVIISSPVQFHEAMCIAAFDAGCDVLVEKPLSNSLDACVRIYEAARAKGRKLAVGFNHRYYPAIKFLTKAIRDGKLGTLDHVRVFGGHDGLSNFRADWQYKGPLSGGGAMMDVGIHMTDLARHIAGEVTDVYGFASSRVWNVEGSEDNAVAIFRTENGVPVSYEATWTEWKGYRFYVEAYGSLGMCRAYYAPMSNVLITHDEPGGKRTKVRKVYPEIILREKFKSWLTTAKISFAEELDDFLGMLAGRPGALADGWSGLRASQIAQAVYDSTASGEPVRLPSRPVGTEKLAS